MSSNCSNARLDRIEKLIEQTERASKEAQGRHERAVARHDREIAEMRAAGRKFDNQVRQWAALGVREARNERRKRRELDDYMTRLAAAQLVTEEKLKQFISTFTGRNGH